MGDKPHISIQYQIYRLYWAGVDLLFPPACAGCGQAGTRWCSSCDASVVFPESICQHCGRAWPGGDLCLTCKQEPPAFDLARTWGTHEKSLRNAIHRLKYHHDLGLAEELAKTMVHLTHEHLWPVDLIVPVPLAPHRFKERGYNQAALIAAPLAWQLGVPHQPKALRRIRETRTQVGLSAQERRANVANAFLADRDKVIGKRILLVDDVMTSGATMRAAAEALQAAGSLSVYGITVSRPVNSRKMHNKTSF